MLERLQLLKDFADYIDKIPTSKRNAFSADHAERVRNDLIMILRSDDSEHNKDIHATRTITKLKAEPNLGLYLKAILTQGKTKEIADLKKTYEEDKKPSTQRTIKLAILDTMIAHPQLTLAQILYLTAKERNQSIDQIKRQAIKVTWPFSSKMKRVLDSIEPGWFYHKAYTELKTPAPTLKMEKEAAIPLKKILPYTPPKW